MAAHCFIGIDQGSSSTKAIAMSDQGQILFQTRRELPAPYREGNRVEFDALAVLENVRAVLEETVLSVQASGSKPAAIGLSCQRSSCLAWNEQSGTPLSPLVSWRDTRGFDLIESLSAQAETIFRITGLPLTPYYSASKLRWLKQNTGTEETGKLTLGTLSSFLCQRLTNADRAIIDHTHAARTQLMNIDTLAWDRDLLALFGLSGIRLPAVVPVVHQYGAIATTAGAIPLLASIGDQQSAMIGLGVIEEGDGGINYGTGGFLIMNTGASRVPAKGLMSSILYSDDKMRYYLLEGSVNAAGDALEWARNNLHLFKNYEELDDLCWQAVTDVVAFIALNGTGAPHWENHLSSSIHGLTATSTSADLIRGVVENIAFFMRDIADVMRDAGMEPAGFSVSGGLSSLSYLVQVQADILQKELRMSARQEVSALGAALLAGLAHGAWTLPDIKKMTGGGEAIAPRKNSGAEKRYQRWKELHRITKELDSLQLKQPSK